jgi:hypothetical protein
MTMTELFAVIILVTGLTIGIPMLLLGIRIWSAPSHHYRQCTSEGVNLKSTFEGNTAGGDLSARGLAFENTPVGQEPNIVRQRKLSVEAIDDILRQ